MIGIHPLLAVAVMTIAGVPARPCAPAALSGFCRVGCPGSPPTLIRRVEPDLKSVAGPYPLGVSVLELGVNKEGRVISACVLRSLRSDFDAAAQAAAMRWLWTPTTVRGQPVGVVMTVAVTAPRFRPRRPARGSPIGD